MRIFARSIIALLFVLFAFVLTQTPSRYVGSQAAFERSAKSQIKASAGSADDPYAREYYEWMRTRDPITNEIPLGIRKKELAFAATLPSKDGLAQFALAKGQRIHVASWMQRGPYNIGGRTRALALDVSNATGNTILAGGVSGGMWRTINGGSSWTKTTALDELQSVSCLVQDIRSGKTNIWYYGTGELIGNSAGARNGSAPLRGDGISKSTDGGLTWSRLTSTSTGVPETFDQMFDYVFTMGIDRSNTSQDEVYAATIGGIVRSTNGGTSWTPVLGSPSILSPSSLYPRFSDVAITSTGIVYAALSERNVNSQAGATSQGIYRSVDGINWTNITPSNFPTVHSRTVLAIAPSNENIVYFLVQGTNGVEGVDQKNSHQLWKYSYQSGNGSGSGGQWINMGANLKDDRSSSSVQPNGNNVFDTQGGYDMLIQVKPDNENFLLAGGTNLYRSSDGGTSWDRIGGYGNPTSFALYPNHHPDLHSGMWKPGSSTIYFSGHDGGVTRTDDITASTVSWTSLNNGYFTTQFYAIAIDHSSSADPKIIGGMQDNSSYFTDIENANIAWSNLLSGDGSYCAISDGSSKYYVSAQRGQAFRGRFDNVTGQPFLEARIDPASGLLNDSYLFVAPFVLDPNDTKIMYFAASYKLFRNSNIETVPHSGGQTTLNWAELNESSLTVGTNGPKISAIGVSKSLANRVYFGTTDGRIFRLDNANTQNGVPTDVWTGKGFPANANVSCLEVDPRDHNKVIAVFSNYSVQSVFYSTDGGSTWTPVGGNLEQNPDGTGNGPSVRWAEILPGVGATTYFVGTSTGLYSTSVLNGMSTVWVQEGASSIGKVVVEMLKVRESDGMVVVGTHGGGVFSTDYLVSVSEPRDDQPVSFRLDQNYPNPFNPVTNFQFSIDNSQLTILKVYDVLGREVATLVDGELDAGEHSVVFDAKGLASGVYYYRMTAGTFVETKKMVLMR